MWRAGVCLQPVHQYEYSLLENVWSRATFWARYVHRDPSACGERFCVITFQTCFMTQPAGRAAYCQSKTRYCWNIFQKISPYNGCSTTWCRLLFGAQEIANFYARLQGNLDVLFPKMHCFSIHIETSWYRYSVPSPHARIALAPLPPSLLDRNVRSRTADERASELLWWWLTLVLLQAPVRWHVVRARAPSLYPCTRTYFRRWVD